MNRNIMIAACLFIIAVFSTADAAEHDSALNWYTIESENFRVHFHDGEDEMAKKCLRIAERIHRTLSVEFDWQPQDKTEMVLTDEYDVSIGFAIALPSNRLYLFATPPDEVFGLEDHAGWLEMLILHEYVHTLHLDKAADSPKWLRKIFGRNLMLFPNFMQPAWMHEGLATYYETDQQRGIGRGQSSYYNMIMRMEVQQGIKPLAQVNQHITSWPAGTTAYLYGVHFFQFIDEQYGAKSITELVNNYSSNLIPFRINSNTSDILGKDLSELWIDFDIYLRNKFQPALDGLTGKGLVAGEAITQNGYFHGQVLAHPDGRIFYVENDGVSESTLMVKYPDGNTDNLSDVHTSSRLDLHPDAGILLAQPEICRNARLHFDLFQINPENGKQTRLTHCARYSHASWSPDGQQIIAVHHALGRYALHLLSASGELQQVLWQGESGVTIAQVDWSPSGKNIAAAVWRKESGWDLELFRRSDKTWQPLTFSTAIEAQPRFTDDGNYLLYSSDSNGIYNIKRLHLATNEVSNISRVLGGAFQPYQINIDSPVYYVAYSAQGRDIHKITDAEGSLEVGEKRGRSAILLPEAEEIELSATREYSSWPSLMPTSWLPYLNINNEQLEFGASIWGSDILNFHHYSLLAGFDVKQQWSNFSLSYTYARFDPQLRLFASSTNLPELDINNNISRITRESRYDAALVYPILNQDWNLNLHLGSSYVNSSNGWLANNARPYRDLTDTVAGVALSWNSAKFHPKSISLSDGRNILLVAENSSLIRGDYRGNIFLADWREYIQLSGKHVLALRAAMGWGTDTPRNFALGGVHSRVILPRLNSETPVFNRRNFSLRGYGSTAGLSGRRMQLASAEYRFPIKLVERGFMSPPIGLHQLFGQIFTDVGGAWNIGNKAKKYYTGSGIELGADMELFYHLPVRLTLGFAYGFDQVSGGNRVYFRMGNSY